MSIVNLFEIEDNCLIRYCGSDAEVMIPNGIQEIGSNAFSACKAFTEL